MSYFTLSKLKLDIVTNRMSIIVAGTAKGTVDSMIFIISSSIALSLNIDLCCQ